MPKKDFSQIAFDVVQRATGEVSKPHPLSQRQANSRKGGLKGGASRMDSLTAAERSELAKKAAAARWKKP